MVYCWTVTVKRAVNNKHCKESCWYGLASLFKVGTGKYFPVSNLSIMIPLLVLIGALPSKYPESQSSESYEDCGMTNLTNNGNFPHTIGIVVPC